MDRIGAMTSPGTLRRLVPRHTKAYLWICFLTLVFGSMLLSDNGMSPYSLLPSTPWADNGFRVSPNASKPLIPLAYVDNEDLTGLTRAQMELLSRGKLFYGRGNTTFTPDDVAVLFKTGATTLWRRVPIHLSTTLANSSLTPNLLFYSDQADAIAGHAVVDALANVSAALKESADFAPYRAAAEAREQNLYLEAAAIEGDWNVGGGWRLDKYKFLPLMQHAQRALPGKKWYVFMEDDTYFFWQSLFAWLGTFDPAAVSPQPVVLGGPAQLLGEDFAHGGSGFAVSGAAMERTFGKHADLAERWEAYAAERCCGDQVLSHVMAQLGAPRDRRYDDTEWAGLQALPTWRMGFGKWNWCSPLFNVHKVHQADVSRLWAWEREWQAQHGEHAVIRYFDLFAALIRPQLQARRAEWDNGAAEQWHASTREDIDALTREEKEAKPWFSVGACEKACERWAECLSWKYEDDKCGLSSTAAQGRKIDAGIFLTSGWMLERIDRLGKKECEPLGYL